MADSDARSVPAVCQEAIDRFRLEEEATANQRKREIAALEFQVPEKQWPAEAIAMREGGLIPGTNVKLPPRVRLSIPTLDQPIQLVLNQERQAQLEPTFHPVSEDADDDTAEVLNGLFRRDARYSRAGAARSWGFERAVKAGRGGYRILKEYDPEGGHPSDQRIVWKRLLHQEAMRLDPYAQEPDFSDMDWGMVAQWMPWTRFKRHWPDATLTGYSDGEFVECITETPEWFREDTQGKAVLVVEYFRKVFTTRTKVALDDGSGAWADAIPEGRRLATGEGAFSREEEDYTIQWSKLTAVEELETEEWDGRYIPLIPCIGRELIPFDAERRWTGMIEPNMDAVRMANYGATGVVESASLEPKAPFDIDPEEIAGYESWWQQANLRNFPYLPRKKWMHGSVVPPPQRLQADMSKVQMNMALYESAQQFLHAGTGAWEASLGQASDSSKTKGGTLALQQQQEQGNSNWLDNLVEISMTYEGKIYLDLAWRVYDRPGRVVRILDLEGKSKSVMLNAPFVMGPNKRPMPAPQGPPPMPPQQPSGAHQPPAQSQTKHFDLAKGRYGVTVSVGKAYQSRVQEGSDRLGQILQADPNLVPILGPNWMRFQDFPGHKEAEDILTKMRDHQFPWLSNEDEPPDAAQQLAKAHAQVQQLTQQLQGAAKFIESKQAEQQGKIQVTQTQEQAETQREVMRLRMEAAEAAKDREVKLAVAQIGAQVDQMSVNLQKMALFLEERARVGAQAHEVGMGAQQQAAAVQSAQMGHQQSLEQGAVGHQQALEQGEQGQRHALEQGEQAAALAPPTQNGSGA